MVHPGRCAPSRQAGIRPWERPGRLMVHPERCAPPARETRQSFVPSRSAQADLEPRHSIPSSGNSLLETTGGLIGESADD
jgi:hypothetical protein